MRGMGMRARGAWQALWTDVNWSMTRRLLVQSAAPLPTDPIFIVGPWRSGTTVMHECMAAATGLPTPQTWQCMNAASFILSGKRASRITTPRPMDGMPVHAESPQEDEFALLTLGADSAYRAFLSPSRLSRLHATLDQQHWLDDPTWANTWVTFLQACLSLVPDRAAPLLLKSPNHTFRIRAILRHFPGARFIWMSRRPDNVFHSNVKMWAAMCKHYGFDDLKPADLEGFLIKAFDRSSETLGWCVSHLEPRQFVVVDTRDLETSPVKTLRKVCDRLGLAALFREEALIRGLTNIYPRFDYKYGVSLPDPAQDASQRLQQACDVARRLHGALCAPPSPPPIVEQAGRNDGGL